SRTFTPPPADPEVGVVALGEDPGVATGDDAELEHELAAVALPIEPVIREVPLEPDPDGLVSTELEGASREPVGPVCSDQGFGLVALSVPGHPHPSVVALNLLDADSVAEIGACGRSLLREKVVEPLALGHVHEGCVGAALDRPPVPEPKVDPCCDVLDDSVQREGQKSRCTLRHPASARLVPGELRAVEQEDVSACRREAIGSGGAGGPSAGDDRLVASHARILSVV